MLVAWLAVLLLSGCGYNTMQSQDEQIKAAWAEVLNQYQRRADLVPNLVNTVKGYAAQEQQVLLGVTNARAKVGSIQATPELINDPQAFARFQAAQAELTSALSRLLVVVGELSAAQIGRELPRSAGAARRHRKPHRGRAQSLHQGRAGIQRDGALVPVQSHRDDVRFKEKPQFTVENEREIAKPPTVDFGTSSPSRDRPSSPPSSSGEYSVPGK